jgi:hypothetical protein
LYRYSPTTRFTSEAIEAIEKKIWNGNVGELKEFILSIVDSPDRDFICPWISKNDIDKALRLAQPKKGSISVSKNRVEEIASKLCDGTLTNQLIKFGLRNVWRNLGILNLNEREIIDALLFVFFSKAISSWKELAGNIQHPYNAVKDQLPRLLGSIVILKRLRTENEGNFENFRKAWYAENIYNPK